ncbi:hypothetical protein [Bdellovibrio bacteriovorus]|uniref:hypothetical protein n=1 Tax=Bdellovibrio bacteriovorus TaxID=959 RepID=UPI0035A5F6E7
MKTHGMVLILGMMMTACAPQGYEAMNNIASQVGNDIACKDNKLEMKLWDGLKAYLIEQKEIPASETLKQAMRDQVQKLAAENPGMTSEDQEKLQAQLDKLVVSLLEEAPKGERVETPEQLLMLLSAIDVGDRSTVFRSYMQDKVRGNFTQLSKTVESFELNCPSGDNSTAGTDSGSDSGSTDAGSGSGGSNVVEEPTPAPNRDYEYHKAQALSAGEPLAVFGARWAFATSYQTCQSVALPDLNAQTPTISGISIVGKHSDGVGSKREIASLSKVQATHPYIKGVSGYGEGCFSVKSNPLIYDYGGKPYGTTAADSPIDMFKNNGDGTKVLGIDCSGYVYTSMATAGLRLKAGRALKASDSWAWGSSSYVEPQNNGLTCLSKISVTPSTSLKAGDIVAVYGHVLLIDKAGSDPFGIASAKTESDCSKIKSSGFDFTVAQSSPNVGGVGINFFDARVYLPTSAKMQTGLEKYAYYACLAKVNNKTYTPNVGTLSVIRHKGTADCMAPRVKMAREACISSCSSLRR